MIFQVIAALVYLWTLADVWKVTFMWSSSITFICAYVFSGILKKCTLFLALPLPLVGIAF